eukprot:201036-Pyramimonas_sp.AAC.1
MEATFSMKKIISQCSPRTSVSRDSMRLISKNSRDLLPPQALAFHADAGEVAAGAAGYQQDPLRARGPLATRHCLREAERLNITSL